MKSPPEAPFLTPAEACALAGVGPTTLKRWADAGLLTHVKTAGGHRRFPREEMLRFIGTQARAATPRPRDGDPWISKLIGGPSHAVEAELLSARGRLGSWHAVAAEVGAVLVRIGELWTRGELSLIDEHMASERLSRALARIGEALPSRRDAPRALLAGLADEEHGLGLALAELCLRELGWCTLWAGPRTPIDELERLTTSMELELVALSASARAEDPRPLLEACQRLERIAVQRGMALALGGEGAWPERPTRARRFRDFESFHRFAGGLTRTRFGPSPI